MNLSSSRSHCIFTILVETRKRGSEKVTRSKLNLVDLAAAGAERVLATLTNSTGQTLREAQHINASSLFYLEIVIVTLRERRRVLKSQHMIFHIETLWRRSSWYCCYCFITSTRGALQRHFFAFSFKVQLLSSMYAMAPARSFAFTMFTWKWLIKTWHSIESKNGTK